jgi:hypothetical protein
VKIGTYVQQFVVGCVLSNSCCYCLHLAHLSNHTSTTTQSSITACTGTFLRLHTERGLQANLACTVTV